MINFRLILVAILIALTSVSGFSQKISKETIVSEGKKRTYYIYVPPSVRPDVPPPVLLLLHGSNRNGLSLVEKWKDIANQEGIILLGPDSADSSRWSIPEDGPEFLRQLLESVKAKYPINERRIYLFGHSGGAIFALLMSLYESEYFASTAIHAGALDAESGPLIDRAKRKIPIQIQVGSEDELFPVRKVRATRDMLNARGFSVQLTEIPRHDHWYYDLAPKINLEAWEFLKTQQLSSEPRFEKYTFNSAGRISREAIAEYNRGIEHQNAGDVAGAIAAYARALKIDPQYAEAYNNRGVAYISQKDYPAAIADFTRSIEIRPSDSAYSNRGSVYLTLKKVEEAITDFTSAIKLKESAEGYIYRGVAYEQTKQNALALADYNRAIQLDPDSARAYANRGLLLLNSDDDLAAQKDFDKAFQLDPSLHAEFDSLISQTRANRKRN
jgi:tetratricopeptide (TPR) repeat protein